MAAWHLRRMYHTEGGFLCVRPTDLKSTIDKNYENLQTADRQAIVSLTDSEGPDTLAKFSRYKARLERSMYRALHELQRRREKAEKAKTGFRSIVKAYLASLSQFPITIARKSTRWNHRRLVTLKRSNATAFLNELAPGSFAMR